MRIAVLELMAVVAAGTGLRLGFIVIILAINPGRALTVLYSGYSH